MLKCSTIVVNYYRGCITECSATHKANETINRYEASQPPSKDSYGVVIIKKNWRKIGAAAAPSTKLAV